MRYVGGGIGHLSQHSKITNSDAMDVDAVDADTTHGNDVHMASGEDQQVHQLEQHNHSEYQVESNDADQADDSDDEGSSDACSGWDSDMDRLKSDNSESDMGPEDGEEFGDDDNNDGYDSL